MQRRSGIRKGPLRKVKRCKFSLKLYGSSLTSIQRYHKNHLKQTLEDFSERLRRTMGCEVVMLVSYKKAGKQLTVSL